MAVFTLTAAQDSFSGGTEMDVVSELSFGQLGATDLISGGSVGWDELYLAGGGVYEAARFSGVSGFERIHFGAGSTAVLPGAIGQSAESQFIGLAAQANTTIDASAFGASIYGSFEIYGANVNLKGGAGTDRFTFINSPLRAGDYIIGNGGSNQIVFSIAGPVGVALNANIRDIGTVTLQNGAQMDVGAGFVAPGGRLAVYNSQFNERLNVLATAGVAVDVTGNTGTDVFISAPSLVRDDTFTFYQQTDLDPSDIIRGGGGTGDELRIAHGGAGVVGLVNIREIEIVRFTYYASIAGAGFTLDPSMFTGVASGQIRIFGAHGADGIVGGGLFAGQSINASGDAGSDLLQGGGGNDILEGGAGVDTIQGGAGVDMASYASSPSFVTVSLQTGATGGGVDNHASGDIITGIENLTGSAFGDTLTGNAQANLLEGGSGADTLYGLDGFDKLAGGTGVDNLYGGAGADYFYFRTLAESGVNSGQRDTIRDFAPGDKIAVHVIDANQLVAGDQAFVFDTNGDFATGEAAFQSIGPYIIARFNTDVDAAAEMEIVVLGVASLGQNDFVL